MSTYNPIYQRAYRKGNRAANRIYQHTFKMKRDMIHRTPRQRAMFELQRRFEIETGGKP